MLIGLRTTLPILAASRLGSRGLARAQRACATMADDKNAVIIEPRSGQHDASVVFLHGLGDTGDGWGSMMPDVDSMLPSKGTVRWVLPHAEDRRITLNGGMRMPGWADILGLSPNDPEDSAGLDESAARVEAIIANERARGAKTVVVGGFSQGGAVALHVALRGREKIDACAVLSSWLPRATKTAHGAGAAGLRLFMAHGDADQVVVFPWGKASHDELVELGADARFVRAPGVGHGADMNVLREMASFLSEIIPRADPKL